MAFPGLRFWRPQLGVPWSTPPPRSLGPDRRQERARPPAPPPRPPGHSGRRGPARRGGTAGTRPPPLTDGGDVRGVELVVGEAAQQAGLAHPGVPDQQQPEQHVVLLRHGWARGRAAGGAGSAPLGRGHRGREPAAALASPARWARGAAAGARAVGGESGGAAAPRSPPRVRPPELRPARPGLPAGPHLGAPPWKASIKIGREAAPPPRSGLLEGTLPRCHLASP